MNFGKLFLVSRSSTIATFLALFAGFVLWAVFTDLAVGVHADGSIENLNPNVAIQHKSVARVARLHVQEGEAVRKGQPLLSLEDDEALADAVRAETLRLGVTLQVEALLAEQRGKATLPYPQAIKEIVPDQIVRQAHADTLASLQQRLLTQRAEQDRFDNELASSESQREKQQRQILLLENQRAIVARQLAGMEAMLPEGLIARSAVDDQRYRLEELQRSRVSLDADLERIAGLIRRTEAERRAYLANRAREVKEKLAEIAPQLEGATRTATAAMIRLRSHVIAAPADGQVINVKVGATGEVVNSGTVLMEFVPTTRRYYVNARINPSEIDSVHPGAPAEIKFPTLPAKSTPMLDGHLLTVATNLTRDEKTGQPYYIVRVEFKDDPVKKLGLEPVLGMPVSVLLKGGERSVLSYLTDPFTALFRQAMKEQ